MPANSDGGGGPETIRHLSLNTLGVHYGGGVRHDVSAALGSTAAGGIRVPLESDVFPEYAPIQSCYMPMMFCDAVSTGNAGRRCRSRAGCWLDVAVQLFAETGPNDDGDA